LDREAPLAVKMTGPLRKKTAPLVVVLLLAVVSFSGCGNDRATPHFSEDIVERLDTAIASEMKYSDLPGVVVGVWVPGEGRYVVARGKANLQTGERRDLKDPFRIASITKTFTATAVLQLVEEGKLSKSDRLSKWYPDFPNADQVTVEDLLRMRSGIAEPIDEKWWEDYHENPLADISAEDMIERSANRGGRFATPGQRTVYTNVNYVILGEIVEMESGEDLGTHISQTILEPLDMENTIYPTDNELPGDLHGYFWDSSTGELEDMTNLNPAPFGGDGAMISDVSVLKGWAEAVCIGKLLEPQTHRARLQTRPIEGWSANEEYGEGIVKMGSFCGHPGVLPGFNSEMWYLPQKDAIIVINANRVDPNSTPPAHILAQTIIEILFPKYASW
jgi:D-alanyl-D-alanine carboxypeptidase